MNSGGSHNHAVSVGNAGDHAHTVTVNNSSAHDHGFTTDGGAGLNGAAHALSQPSLVLGCIIKE